MLALSVFMLAVAKNLPDTFEFIPLISEWTLLRAGGGDCCDGDSVGGICGDCGDGSEKIAQKRGMIMAVMFLVVVVVMVVVVGCVEVVIVVELLFVGCLTS